MKSSLQTRLWRTRRPALSRSTGFSHAGQGAGHPGRGVGFSLCPNLGQIRGSRVSCFSSRERRPPWTEPPLSSGPAAQVPLPPPPGKHSLVQGALEGLSECPPGTGRMGTCNRVPYTETTSFLERLMFLVAGKVRPRPQTGAEAAGPSAVTGAGGGPEPRIGKEQSGREVPGRGGPGRPPGSTDSRQVDVSGLFTHRTTAETGEWETVP